MKEWDRIMVSQDADGLWGFYKIKWSEYYKPYKERTPGRQVFKQRWHGAKDFSEEGLAAVNDGRCWGFINLKGELAIPYQWKECLYFSEGVCAVNEVCDEWWIIDTRGKKLAKFNKVVPIEEFSEGLCRVKDESGKEGFTNKKGRVVIPCKWDEVRMFFEGLAGVKDDAGLWGFINRKGKIVIPNKWKEILDGFDDGECGVRNSEDEEWQFVDTRGNILNKTTKSMKEESEPPYERLCNPFSFTNERPYNLFSFTNFKNLLCNNQVCKDSLLAIILGGIGILLLVLLIVSDYDVYNTEAAYQPFSLYWWVSYLGGIHTYDLFLPLTVALVFLKPLIKIFKPNNDSPDEDDRFSRRVIVPVWFVLSIFFVGYYFDSFWIILIAVFFFWFLPGIFFMKYDLIEQRIWALTVYLLLIMAPLRLIYVPLFTINNIIVDSRSTIITEIQKTSAHSDFFVKINHYYFILNVDEDIPYRLRIGEDDFNSIRNGKTSKAKVEVCKGCLGFSFVEKYKLIE